MTKQAWQFDAILLWAPEPERMTAEDVRFGVGAFVSGACRYGLLTQDDLPEEVTLSLALSAYDGQVSNGGHWQFAVNTRMQPILLDRIGRCLDAVGVADHIAIFRDFLAMMDAHKTALPPVELLDDREWRPSGLGALDTRFFEARERTRLWDAHQAWLSGTGRLRFVESYGALDAAYAKAIEAHPDFEARREEIEAAKAEERRAMNTVSERRVARAIGILFDAIGLTVTQVGPAVPGATPGERLFPVTTGWRTRTVKVVGVTATLMKNPSTPTGYAIDTLTFDIHPLPPIGPFGRFIKRFTGP